MVPDELPIEVHCIGVTSAHAFASDQGMTALAQLGLSRLPTGALRQTPSQRGAPSLRRIDSTPQVVAGDHVELRDLHGELLISLPAGAHEVVDLRAAAWVVTPAFEARLPDLVAEGRLYVGGVAAAKLPMALHRLSVDAARGQLWLIYRGVLAKPPRGGDPVMAVALAAAGTVIPWPASVGRRVVASKPGFDETVVLRDADAEPKDLTATLAVSPRHAAREQAPFALAPAGKKGGDQPAEAPPSGAGLPWKDGDERPVPQLPSEGLEVTVGLGEADDVAAARALLEARELAEKKERAAVAAQERGSGRAQREAEAERAAEAQRAAEAAREEARRREVERAARVEEERQRFEREQAEAQRREDDRKAAAAEEERASQEKFRKSVYGGFRRE